MRYFKYFKQKNYHKIVFDNSKKANCFGHDQAKELNQVLKKIKADTPEVLVWQSAGRNEGRNIFCAGGNLKAYKELDSKEDGLLINREILAALNELYQLPCIKIALLEGDVYGGGLELLSSFDAVVALSGVKLAFWQSKQSLSTGWGGFTRWSQKIEEYHLERLISSAEYFTPNQAIEYGFVDKVVSSSEETEAAILKIIKNKSQQISSKKLDYTKEVELFESLWWSEDHLKILKSLDI